MYVNKKIVGYSIFFIILRAYVHTCIRAYALKKKFKLFLKNIYNLLFFFVTLIYQSLKVEVEIAHRESRLQPTLYFFY